MHETKHHIAKPAIIGEIKADGQFEIISCTETLTVPEPFSQFALTAK